MPWSKTTTRRHQSDCCKQRPRAYVLSFRKKKRRALIPVRCLLVFCRMRAPLSFLSWSLLAKKRSKNGKLVFILVISFFSRQQKREPCAKKRTRAARHMSRQTTLQKRKRHKNETRRVRDRIDHKNVYPMGCPLQYKVFAAPQDTQKRRPRRRGKVRASRLQLKAAPTFIFA